MSPAQPVALPPDAGPVLTGLARAAIAQVFDGGALPHDQAAWLDAPGASFVTLTQSGRLRGCIGSLQAWQPLRDDVAGNACAAAFRDPRFPALRAEELPVTQIEVSVLSAPEPMPFTSQADALAQLRPGQDGVILSAGRHRATFLPQVWEELPTPAEFISHLLLKAGLPPDYWSDAVQISRYSVTAFSEGGG